MSSRKRLDLRVKYEKDLRSRSLLPAIKKIFHPIKGRVRPAVEIVIGERRSGALYFQITCIAAVDPALLNSNPVRALRLALNGLEVAASAKFLNARMKVDSLENMS